MLHQTVMLDPDHEGYGTREMQFYSLALGPSLYFPRRELKIYLQKVLTAIDVQTSLPLLAAYYTNTVEFP